MTQSGKVPAPHRTRLPQDGGTVRAWYRHGPTLGVLACGAAFSVLAAFSLGDSLDQAHRSRFKQEAVSASEAVVRTLDHYVADVKAVAAFATAMPALDRERFRVMARSLVEANRGFDALEWIPRVEAGRRAEFEHGMQAAGFPGFALHAGDPGKPVAIEPERERFPVQFVEPYAANRAVVGFDVASDPLGRAALDLARDTGEVGATGRIRSIAPAGSSVVLLVHPVYRSAGAPSTVEDRRAALAGFTAAVVRLEELVAAARAATAPGAIEVALVDTAAGATPGVLVGRAGDAAGWIAELEAGLHHAAPIRIGTATWKLVVTPGHAASVSPGRFVPWLLLALGLALTGGIARFVWRSAMREAEIEAARQTLAESERRFTLVIEAGNAGYWDWDIVKGTVDAGASTGRRLGYATGEVEPDTMAGWAALVHPDDRAKVNEALGACLAGRVERFETEHRMQAKSDRWVWILFRGQVLERDGDGRATRAGGTFIEINALKQAEATLRASEERFHDLTRLSSDWYWEQDEDHRFTVAVGQDEFRSGLSAASHVGRCRWELPGTSPVNCTWEEHRAVLAAREEFRDLVLRRVDRHGSPHFLSVSGAPIHDASGRFRGYRGVARDVTSEQLARMGERELTRELEMRVSERTLALAAAEGRQRALLAASPDLMFRIDRGGRFLDFAARPEDPVMPAGSVVGGRLHDTGLPPAVVATALEKIELAIRTGTMQSFEYAIDMPGGMRSFEARIARSGEGEVVSTVRDVTERVRAREALEAHGRDLAEAQRIACMGSWRWDIAANRMHWSDELFRVLGYAPGAFEATFERHLESVHAEDRLVCRQKIHAALRDLRPFDWEYRAIRADGLVRRMRSIGEVIVGPDGRPVGMKGTCQDVTDRWRAETALRESEERLRATFEQAAVGLAHRALDGTFLRVNDKYCEITGRAREDLLSVRRISVTHPDDRGASAARQLALREGRMDRYSIEKRILRPDGTALWVDASVSLVRNSAGEPWYQVVVLQDVTERRRTARENAEHGQRLSLTNAVLAGATAGESPTAIIDRVIAMLHGYFPQYAVMHGNLSDDGRCTVGTSRGTAQVRGLAGRVFDLSGVDALPGGLRGGEPVVVERGDAGANHPGLAALLAAAGMPSGLFAPVLVDGRVTGCIALAAGARHRWTDHERETLRELCGYIGLAVRTAQGNETRARAVEALRESEGRFRDIAENLPFIVWMASGAGRRIEYVNRAFETVFGLRREDLYRDPGIWLAAVHPDDRDAASRVLFRGRPDGAGEEYRIARPDGTELWLLDRGVHVEAWHDAGGLHVGAAIDITLRKGAERLQRSSSRELELRIEARTRELAAANRALLEREQLLRRTFDDLPIGAAMIDASGRFIRANSALCRMLGHDHGQLLGMSLDSVRHADPGERERSRRLTARLYDGEIASYDLETRCMRKDGSVAWVHLSVGLIRDDGGAPAYALAVIEDISQRKLLESERAASERRHRDALVREVHHRIKNHVQGVAGLLRQQARRNAAPHELVEHAVAQLSSVAVVHGLRTNTGHDAVSLADMLRAIAGLAERSGDGRVRLRLDLDRVPDACVGESEAVAMALVLNELLANAVRHAQGGAAREVAVSLDRDAALLRLRIRNPGGLPEGFDFATGARSGTGLGIVQALLPRAGAKLVHSAADGWVETLLELSPPVVQRTSKDEERNHDGEQHSGKGTGRRGREGVGQAHDPSGR